VTQSNDGGGACRGGIVAEYTARLIGGTVVTAVARTAPEHTHTIAFFSSVVPSACVTAVPDPATAAELPNSILPSPVSSTAAVTPAREKAIRRGAVAFRRLSIMPMPMNPATIRAQFVGSGTAPGLVGFTGVTGVIGGVGRIIG